MFKVNNKNTKATSRRSGVFIVNFEHVNVSWVSSRCAAANIMTTTHFVIVFPFI